MSKYNLKGVAVTAFNFQWKMTSMSLPDFFLLYHFVLFVS